MGDLHDMEGALGFNNSKTSGLLDTLGYGFGFGDNMNDRMRDYYEIDQYSPANVQPVMDDYEVSQTNALPATPPSMLEDIIAGRNVDPFDEIASMFSGSQEQDAGGYADDEGFGGMGANE